MRIPSLKFEQPHLGKSRQPVPLRLAYLVTGLDVGEFLLLLATRQENRYEYLTAYEYTPGQVPREVRREFYEEIDKQVSGATDASKLLRLLPTNHFVWSDDLAYAFSAYLRDYPGYDDAHVRGMGLCWNPALHEADALIEECVDLSDLAVKATSTDSTEQANIFRRSKAGGWEIRFEGRSCGPCNDSRGLNHLKHLLQSPHKSLSAIELSAIVHQPSLTVEQQKQATIASTLIAGSDVDDSTGAGSLSVTLGGDAGEVIDAKAL